ncbi:hypothetical protein [Streptomyces rimosus]|uniref:hypothetical protein n=1 Tax=Streptomyces rimosus TaxID=1927 RepID=UPI0004C20D21|nr:hypothetical protein [Streptomyces rimosus]
MTTPQYLAHLPTHARSQALRALERTRLNDAIAAACKERRTAKNTVQRLNEAIDRARTEAGKLIASRWLFPPSPEADARRAQLAAECVQLAREHRDASALSAAAEVVYESARLERAWLDRPDPRTDGPIQMLATPLPHFSPKEVTAPGYTVIVLHPDPHSFPALFWREFHNGTVNRSRARAMLMRWSEREQSYVLRDPHGRLYVAAPGVRLELTPTDIAPPHTDGDALRAALAAYGFPAYRDSAGGQTWLVVPLDRSTPEADMYEVPHFRIISDEQVDRPASQHVERWSASAYDGDGECIDVLDPAPVGSTLAEDCAYVARAIDAFEIPRVQG